MNVFSGILMFIAVAGYPIWVLNCRKNDGLKFKLLIIALGECIFISIFLRMYWLLLPALLIYWLVWYIYVKRNR